MKKRRFPFLQTVLLLFLQVSIYAQDVSLEWARQVGGFEYDSGHSIAVDASGNVYTIGLFFGAVDFDPGAGVHSLNSVGDTDIFIQKLDASGNLVWVIQLGGLEFATAGSIAVGASGDIYSIGSFRDTVDFDPGVETYNLISAGWEDIFVQKLDASGNLVWAKQMGGDGFAKGLAMTIDPLGNVYSTGSFTGTADFDPGVDSYHLNSLGDTDVFVQKLDASGNFVWARQIGGMENQGGLGISVDVQGNIYTTGIFRGVADFDPGEETYNLSSTGGVNAFIQKLDASGSFVWAKQMGGTNYVAGFSISVDDLGNVYTVGGFGDTVDFDPGAATLNLSSLGSQDGFIQKLNTNGELIWVGQIGGAGFDNVASIYVDALGSVYITGSFSETVDFDPGVDTFYLSSAGGGDIFIQKLNASGSMIWTKKMGGIEDDFGNSIFVDPIGNIYVTGGFEETVDFDPGTDIVNLSSTEYVDIFVLKLNDYISGNDELKSNLGVLVYPNPTSNILTIDIGNNLEMNFRLFDNVGQHLISKTFGDQTTLIDLSEYTPGIYFLIFNNHENSITHKIVKL